MPIYYDLLPLWLTYDDTFLERCGIHLVVMQAAVFIGIFNYFKGCVFAVEVS
ncbi:hypothetical protein ACK3Y0_09560 [Aeromonas caviae]|uniref:hypothetical protein n=1 Tax=Aeromonas caviae TaxID=648 RepID=UPI002B49CFA0|nr:hypothetical protein [Aeromonas caviae]